MRKLNMVSMFILMVFAVYMSVSQVTNRFPHEQLDDLVASKISLLSTTKVSYILLITVGVMAIYLFMQKFILLPFLGETVMPTGLLKPTFPSDFTHTAKLDVIPNTTVVYWGADPDKTNSITKGPEEAYGDYTNSGVAISDNKGVAEIKFKFPQRYVLSFGRVNPPHIHYRYKTSNGMMSRIYTHDLSYLLKK